MSASWLLESITVIEVESGEQTIFGCDQWLDKQVRHIELLPGEKSSGTIYTVEVRTGNSSGAGTNSNVFLTMVGSDASSGELSLKSSEDHVDKFERGQLDTFKLHLGRPLGELQLIRVRSDGSGMSSDWELESVTIRDTMGKEWTFACGQWFDNQVSQLELLPGGVSTAVSYKVAVETGGMRGAGTDSNVYATLVGEEGESGEVQLKKSAEHTDKFERGQTDTFTITLGRPLGDIQKVTIRFDASGLFAKWYLSKVTVRKVGETETPNVFACEQWLDKQVKQVTLEKGAEASTTLYKAVVVTSDVKGSGTDSNVWLTIFGTNGDSGELALKKSAEHMDKFERGQTDTFSFTLAQDLGDVNKVSLRFDFKGLAADWLPSRVIIMHVSSGKEWEFKTKEWLTKQKPKLDLEYIASTPRGPMAQDTQAPGSQSPRSVKSTSATKTQPSPSADGKVTASEVSMEARSQPQHSTGDSTPRSRATSVQSSESIQLPRRVSTDSSK